MMDVPLLIERTALFDVLPALADTFTIVKKRTKGVRRLQPPV
jgi:hypothetical protein